MSRPRYRWWGYVKNVIRAYPELRKKLMEPIHMPVTAKYGPHTGQNGAGRALEGAVAKRLSGRDVAEFEAVDAAIRETAKLENGEARLAIIDLVYWKRSHTLAGAGMRVGYSYSRTKDFHQQFFMLVAKKLKLFDNIGPKSQKTGVG